MSKTHIYLVSGKFMSRLLFALSLVIFFSCKDDETTLPRIIDFSPQNGQEGTSVTVKGQNFGSSISDVQVSVGGVPVEVTSVSPTSLKFNVSEDALTGNIIITVAGKSVRSSLTFEVYKTPYIESFNPQRGIAGTLVTIQGTNFSKTSSENIVKFSGIPATVISGSSTSLIVEVPQSTHTGLVSVTANDLTGSSISHFIITPQITSIEPLTGVTGTEVQIKGAGFSPYNNDMKVLFNSVEAAIISTTTSSLTVIVPEQASKGKIRIEVLNEPVVSASDFNVFPKVTGLSSTEGTVGTDLIITGSGFSRTVSENLVQFNGIQATISQATVNQLVVKVPNGATSGLVTVTVNNLTAVAGQFKVRD